jgi:eukaryotic-like serine/threonine-protein kinase
MGLEVGTRLGSHEIVGLLGVGGMGEVYRATDTRLKRDVAIKVLPEAFLGDPDRVARFQREAELLASLNHPNIAAIYGLEQRDRIIAIVLELVEGETLADVIARGPIALADALPVAHQICEALEAAHDKGVVHRDLKPANIKITPDGRVKVLDFGLAKMLDPAEAGSAKAGAMSMSPTLSVHATYAGVILGTAAYMSPEQARGKPVDRRTDVWAFGCVLYEMLTGKHAFEPGETVSDAIASVLTREPDATTLPADTPPPIRRLLRRCLHKDPQQRLPHIGAVRLEIEDARVGSPEERVASTPAAAEPLARRSRGGPRALAVVALLALAALASGYAAWKLKPESARSIARFNLALPSDQTFTSTLRQFVALSPDGSTIAYIANGRVWIRPLSGLDARPVTASEVVPTSPVFSPDGQSIAFTSASERALKRAAITGGTAMTLASPIDVPFGLSWDASGILIGQVGKGILRVSSNGGRPEVIVPVPNDEMATAPQMLPGGTSVLFSLKKATETWDQAKVVVQRLDTNQRTTVITGGADGRYAPTGHVMYAASGVLLAVPFDVKTLTVTGAPVPIIDGIQRTLVTTGGTGLAQYAFSTTGDLVYVAGSAKVSALGGDRDLAIFDRNGGAQPLKLPPGAYRAPRVSPNGKFVAFDSDDAGDEVVWIYELAGGSAPRRLTFGGRNRSPVWSPDGQWVAFESDREGDPGMFRQRADGSGPAERLTRPEKGAAHTPQSWSPDGAHILVTVRKEQQFTLQTWSTRDRTLTPLGEVQSVEPTEAAFSPDGRWVVYQSRTANRPREVFVQPFPPNGAKYLVPIGPNTATGGAGHPHWTRKGAEIVVNAAPTQNYAISFKTTPQVAFGQPVDFPRIGRSEPNPSTGRRAADAMPEGDRIVGITQGVGQGGQVAPMMTMVLNWFADVKQRVPVK